MAGRARRSALAARGESLPAFAREASPKGDERGIPSGLLRSEARIFSIFGLFGSSPEWRRARLGAAAHFHHGLLAERAKRWVCGLAFVSIGSVAQAQSGLLVPTSTGRPDATVLSLRDMTIDASIARGYARVNVRQIFENHTDQIQEGTYRFALAPSAAIGDFAVWDGLVRIPGVILEKRRARAIYEALSRQRVDPGLLQQGDEEDREPGEGPAASSPSGAAPFSVKVAPIPARATKRLELQFQQDVNVAGLMGEFRMALAPIDGEPLVARTLRIRVGLNGLAHEATAEWPAPQALGRWGVVRRDERQAGSRSDRAFQAAR